MSLSHHFETFSAVFAVRATRPSPRCAKTSSRPETIDGPLPGSCFPPCASSARAMETDYNLAGLSTHAINCQYQPLGPSESPYRDTPFKGPQDAAHDRRERRRPSPLPADSSAQSKRPLERLRQKASLMPCRLAWHAMSFLQTSPFGPPVSLRPWMGQTWASGSDRSDVDEAFG